MMAELVEETSREETRDDGGAFADLAEANPNLLLELNLLIMVLSLVNSLSPEDRLNYAERERGNFRDQEEQQACMSRLHSRRHDINEFKLAGRRAQRFQQMIKDCRSLMRHSSSVQAWQKDVRGILSEERGGKPPSTMEGTPS
ncbi:hypothetical protein D5086_008954 [Populus alba]|uniref:Uncharacterized protein n=1 Tax=Populus alba TaxID=43335 RepID=A0ACC4CHB9_POPAL